MVSRPKHDVAHVFVGRQWEMAELRAALNDAPTGYGRLIMLAVEPGIGKTRTAQEFAALAEERRAQVLWGRCYEEEEALPHSPWVQPMRDYVRQAGAEQITAEMGPGAANITEIIVEIRDELPDLETLPALEPEQARFRLLEEALTLCRKAGYRPEMAWSCCDYADAQRQRGADGDPGKAMTLLHESLAISTGLGMPPLMERVAEQLELSQAQPETAPAYPGGLTQQEVEVLSLVAAGKSNAGIAEDLVVSPNTVVRHVSNILARTGSSKRTEAARYAAQHGLAE